MLNRVLIEGNLKDDPELIHNRRSQLQASFFIACHEKGQKRPNWFQVVAFREKAEEILHGKPGAHMALEKGCRVQIIGRLDQWVQRIGDTTVNRVQIIPQEIAVLTAHCDHGIDPDLALML